MVFHFYTLMFCRFVRALSDIQMLRIGRQGKLLDMGGAGCVVLICISRTTPAREEELSGRLPETPGVMTFHWVALDMLLMMVGCWGSQLKGSRTSGTPISLADQRLDATSQLPGLFVWHLETTSFLCWHSLCKRKLSL